MDEVVTKEDVLEIFSPYWTKGEHFDYLLDFGREDYQGIEIHNTCHFDIRYFENSSAVHVVTIFKPVGSIEMEQAVFQLIHRFPMFVTYPSSPLMVITANQKCAELTQVKYPEFFEEMKVVQSFDEYMNT